MPTEPRFELALVWLRRDLRLQDHAALAAALRAARRVALAFVFDTDILTPLLQADGGSHDRRLVFIHASLAELDAELRQHGSALLIEHGAPAQCIPALAARLGAQAVFAARDVEPAAIARDAEVAARLGRAGIGFESVLDHLLVDPTRLLTAAGKPYGVYTPYRNAWMRRLQQTAASELQAHDGTALPQRLQPLSALPGPAPALPPLRALGFDPAAALPPGLQAGASGADRLLDDFLARIDDYERARDFPAVRGGSYLSVHLRFGTVSPRRLAALAWQRTQQGSAGAACWLNELIWRDFYAQVLYHHPRVVDHAFRPEYDRIVWARDAAALQAWSQGRTGYPLVDAGMRQLLATGFMHNRLRMVTASFLCKDLGLDWRLGEAHFARHLNDFDLASNNGGWQWAASSGCDAQPWFRIFNPVTQSQKFDPRGQFIRRYVPELAGLSDAAIHAPWLAAPVELAAAGVTLGRDYPAPWVDHAQARERTLARYAVVKAARD